MRKPDTVLIIFALLIAICGTGMLYTDQYNLRNCGRCTFESIYFVLLGNERGKFYMATSAYLLALYLTYKAFKPK